jgi:hypothetical protein
MTKPSYEEIFAYCESRHPSVDPVAFFLHYETNGWMVGKVPMKNWKAGIANWDRMREVNGKKAQLNTCAISCRACMDAGTLAESGLPCTCVRGQEVKQARDFWQRQKQIRLAL